MNFPNVTKKDNTVVRTYLFSNPRIEADMERVIPTSEECRTFYLFLLFSTFDFLYKYFLSSYSMSDRMKLRKKGI